MPNIKINVCDSCPFPCGAAEHIEKLFSCDTYKIAYTAAQIEIDMSRLFTAAAAVPEDIYEYDIL